MIRGIRGAITCDHNSREEILRRTEELLSEIFKRNEIEVEKISAIIFTVTKDLNKTFPAEAARKMGLKFVPLLDMQEMDVEGALEKVIRVLVLYDTEKSQNEIKHVYLRGASNLRRDLDG